MTRSFARPSLCSLAVVLAALLVGCTHYAGVLKKYDDAQPVAGTAVADPAAQIELQLTADIAKVAVHGRLRGKAVASVAGTIEYEVTSHAVDAVHEYDFLEATLGRAIMAPFYLVFLGPFLGEGQDYGDDGAVGFGDHLLDTIHVCNPLMAWPLSNATAGDDVVVATRRERRPARVDVPTDLELVLVSHRGSRTLPAPVDAEGRFEVDLLPALEQVWDEDLRAELRERRSGEVAVLRAFAARARDYLGSIGRRQSLEWAIACEQDTRPAYARFLAMHRGSNLAAEVEARLHELEWREAQAAGDRAAYTAFLARRPRSHHVAEVHARLHELDWAAARRAGDRAAFVAFRQKRPDSPHATEAGVRIEAIAWQEAVRADTVAGYTQFLAELPDGEHAEAARRRRDEIALVMDWQRVQRVDTAAAYRDFVATHPQAPAAAAARTRLGELERHADEWLAACRVGSAQGFRQYQVDHPDSPYSAAADRAIQDLDGRDIVDLIEEGKVEVKTAGSSIQSVRVEVRRLTPYPLKVRVPIGSYFVAARASAQNMVVTREATVDLGNDGWRHVGLAAACANQPKDIPGRDDSFHIERPQHLAELARLMPVLDRAGVDYGTRQAAVWIVTDDATYGSLGHLVRRTVGSAHGGSRVIGATEAARAIRLCAEAGIAIEATRILADRPAFLPSLPDGELKTWLAAQVEAPRKR